MFIPETPINKEIFLVMLRRGWISLLFMAARDRRSKQVTRRKELDRKTKQRKPSYNQCILINGR